MTIRHVASMWWTMGEGISSLHTNLRCVFFSFHVLLIIHRIPLNFRGRYPLCKFPFQWFDGVPFVMQGF